MTNISNVMRGIVQHYNPQKYWKMRDKIVNPESRLPRIIKLYYLWCIKRSDAFNNASLGTNIGYGAKFASIPNFPHGLYGIVISPNAVIGENCTIYHQETIGDTVQGGVTIGNNVFIFPGAKITGKITIGDNVIIGTNCVVFEDIPSNSVVVMNKPRILINKRGEKE